MIGRIARLFRPKEVKQISAPRPTMHGHASWYRQQIPAVNDRRKTVYEGWYPADQVADARVASDLRAKRAQCSELGRSRCDGVAYINGLASDLIGGGITVEPTTENPDLNAFLREAWDAWWGRAGLRGETMVELQHRVARALGVAGSCLWRRVDDGGDLRIMDYESQWLADDIEADNGGNRICMGIEMDRLGRVVALWIRPPWSLAADIRKAERVPSSDIVYIANTRMPGQVLGDPLMVPLIERILVGDDLVMTELQTAQNANNFALHLRQEAPSYQSTAISDTDRPTEVSPGAIIYGDETPTMLQPNRPNIDVASFHDAIKGDLAGGGGLSRAHWDRDSSRGNYAGSRIDAIMGERLLRPLVEMLKRNIASRPYRWMVEHIAPSIPRGMLAGVSDVFRHTPRAERHEVGDPREEMVAVLAAYQAKLLTYEEACNRIGSESSWKEKLEQAREEMAEFDGSGFVHPWKTAISAPRKPGEAAPPDGSGEDPGDDNSDNDNGGDDDE